MDQNWPFSPNSPQAQATANLFFFIMAIAGVIFAIVLFGVLYSTIRYRHRIGQGEPPQKTGNLYLEIIWTLIPSLILAVVFIYMLRVMKITNASASAQEDMIVIGHQWWWEVRYPKDNVVTANEIHLPIGKRMLLRLESADVIHDLWIPQLGNKMDLVPGQTNWMYMQADKPGVFLGTCAEFCGVDHALMRVEAIAQSQQDYDAWIKAQSQQVVTPELAQSPGAQLFVQLPCKSCHTIAGLPSFGDIGPNLSHVASRDTLAAGVISNTPENLAAWLRDPQVIKPGNHMPNLGLTDAQINDLVTFLEKLK
jgi:cytochrome c oxidase subunit 2